MYILICACAHTLAARFLKVAAFTFEDRSQFFMVKSGVVYGIYASISQSVGTVNKTHLQNKNKQKQTDRRLTTGTSNPCLLVILLSAYFFFFFLGSVYGNFASGNFFAGSQRLNLTSEDSLSLAFAFWILVAYFSVH